MTVSNAKTILFIVLLVLFKILALRMIANASELVMIDSPSITENHPPGYIPVCD